MDIFTKDLVARLGITLLIFLFFAAGLLRVGISDDASEGMLSTNPQKAHQYEEFLQNFPSDQTILVVLVDVICSQEGWRLLLDLESELSRHPFVDKTISLASKSAKYIEYSADEVRVQDFRDRAFDDPEERCNAASTYGPFNGTLVSHDGSAVSILVLTDIKVDAVTLSRAFESIVKPYRDKAESIGGKLVLTGEPVMSAEVSSVVASDTVYVLVNVLIMLSLLYWLTRSWVCVLAAFVLNLFVLTIAYGAMGWLGVMLTPATSLVIFLLVPISSAFVVHAYSYSVASDGVRKSSKTFRLAFLLAGTSTAIGFASTGLSPTPDIQRLALMGVIGIAAATAGVFLFVFPILMFCKIRSFHQKIKLPVSILTNQTYGVVFLAILSVVSVIGYLNLSINYGPTNYLPALNDKRADFDLAGSYFGRMTIPLVIKVENAEDPKVYKILEPLVSELRESDASNVQVSWLTDQLTELTKAFTLDSSGNFLEFPDSQSMLSQLLLLLEPKDLEGFLNASRDQVLLTMQIPFEGSKDYFALKAKVDSFLESEQLEGYFVGRVSSFFEAGHRMGSDTLRGLALGAIVVFLVLTILFRSLPLAFAGIVVNTLPVLAGIGILGLLGIDIDMGRSIVAAIAFGIILDDSTHLLVRVRALVSSGYDPSTAVTKAVNELMTPIVTTTLIICVGYSVLLFAELLTFHDFAIVILITLVAALLSDILVLPMLVRRLFKDPLGRHSRD